MFYKVKVMTTNTKRHHTSFLIKPNNINADSAIKATKIN